MVRVLIFLGLLYCLANQVLTLRSTKPFYSEIERAKYGAMRERSVGLGVMGFHSFLQSKMIMFESLAAAMWNKKIFEHIPTHLALPEQ